MPREKRLLIDVSAKAHRKFKIEAAKSGKTMSKILCAYMEKFVAVDNPGDDVEKKTDNPGPDLKSPEEILADKILEGRKAWEDLKKLEKEPVDESLKVYTVEKLDEIRKTKEPVIEEPVIEEPVIEEPVIEEPVIEEPEKAMAAENNPGSDNPKEEGRKKKWWDWIHLPMGFERRKK